MRCCRPDRDGRRSGAARAAIKSSDVVETQKTASKHIPTLRILTIHPPVLGAEHFSNSEIPTLALGVFGAQISRCNYRYLVLIGFTVRRVDKGERHNAVLMDRIVLRNF